METKEAIRLFLNSRKAKGLSPQTIRWYKGILELFALKYQKVPNSPEQIEAFLLTCRAGDERRHGYYRALRAFYRWLGKRKQIKNPIDIVEAPRRAKKSPRALMPDQLHQLLNYPHPASIKACLLFLADTGSRIGELSSLDIKNLIETPDGYVAKISGKTGERLVPMSNQTYYALNKVLPLPWSPYRLRRLISFAFRNAHVPGTAHTLRHTFGSLWYGDETALQEIMGHAHIGTTRLYRHLRTQRLSEQHAKYSPLKMIMAGSREMFV